MSEKTLSIIIPAFNAERYLHKGLPSFLNNKTNDDLEVIIVNDGSTDNTLDIAHAYSIKYPKVFRIIDKKNNGHGSCINEAVKVVRGKYFKVVDADDWVQTENLYEYLNCLKESSSDIILNHFNTVHMMTGKVTPYKVFGIDFNRSYRIEELEPMGEAQVRWFCIHAITYRTDFYRKIKISLSERVFYEDTEYATVPYAYAKSVEFFDLSLYQYLIGNVSQSVSASKFASNYKHLEVVFNKILDFHSAINSPSCAYNFIRIRLRLLLGTYEKVMLLYHVDRKFARQRVAYIRRALKGYDSILVGTHFRHFCLCLANRLSISKRLIESMYRVISRGKRTGK